MELATAYSTHTGVLVGANPQPSFAGFSDEQYVVRLAEDPLEVESALRLRYEVFRVELRRGDAPESTAGLEFDAYDFKCRHLIVVSKASGRTVGTYRLNSIETALSTRGFYSASEFTIEHLPREVLQNGIEIGRACIAREHRNTKVLFLLWKALLACLKESGKRYFFGCCSIFTRDASVGRLVYGQLMRDGHVNKSIRVMPCRNGLSVHEDEAVESRIELPALFNMYLRIGAKVCGPPTIDKEFGTIDYFVLLDTNELTARHRKMFS